MTVVKSLMSFSSMLRPVAPYSRYSDVYDDVIGRDLFQDVSRLFNALIRRHRIAFRSAADLGCGTGLFARFLSHGWRIPVFGVDASPAMLRRAASNCHGSRVSLLCQDIRRLELPRRVDLMTANVDTINHLLDPEEVRQLFRRVHEQLSDGGHFVFDFLPPCGPKPMNRVIAARSCDGASHVMQRIRWIPAGRLLRYRLLVRGPNHVTPKMELHTERTYALKDIARWLAECGFIVREVLDAARNEHLTSCPRRVVVVAQKRRLN